MIARLIPVMLAAIIVSSPSWAGQYNKSGGVSYMEVKAKVTKLIPKQDALMVKDKDDGKEIHIHVDPDVLKTLVVGDNIEFQMQGSNCVITKVSKQ